MKKTYQILFFLFFITTFFVMCNDKNENQEPDPNVNPTPNTQITEYILSAEITNKQGSAIEFSNKTKNIKIKIPRYLDKRNVSIKLTLNKGVSMAYPATEEAEYDLLDDKTRIWLSAEGNSIVFDITSEDIIGESSTVAKADIRDMVLIYDGGNRDIVWDEKNFAPYISIQEENTTKHRWLFDGFLFLEIHDGTYSFASGYTKTPARKREWVGLMNGYLKDTGSMRSLDNSIEQIKNKAPNHGKRKIVISLPEPIRGQRDWGEINGKSMNFSNTQDRITSVKWYIDFLIEEFKKAELKNLQLAGFYWLAEEATNTRDILREVSDYIKEKDLKFYWIPYFDTDGWREWNELGFDKAFQQPNHFFHEDIPDERIDLTCRRAKEWGMGLELEFDSRATTSGGWAYRLKAYINGFKKHGVFENSDIAYYHGGNGFYDLKNGTAEDLDLYKELTNIIADRQEKFHNE